MDKNANLTRFTSFLEKATDAITCDKDCQRLRVSSDLMDKYTNAKYNLITAPEQVDSSFKRLVTYTRGSAAYDTISEKKARAEATELKTEYMTNLRETVGDIIGKTATYEQTLNNHDYMNELYLKYKAENAALKASLKNSVSATLVNDRKTYYGDQQISSIAWYYYAMLYLYIAIILAYVVSIFKMSSPYSKKQLGAIVAVSILYIFISGRVFSTTSMMYGYVAGVMPTDVYRTE